MILFDLVTLYIINVYNICAVTVHMNYTCNYKATTGDICSVTDGLKDNGILNIKY